MKDLKNDKLFADVIYQKGCVYTADHQNSLAEAVAIKGGKIIAVGSSTSILQFRSRKTEVVDLKGKMILPGFIDAHLHPPGNKLYDLYGINLSGTTSCEDVKEAIVAYCQANPNLNNYFGSGWSISIFDGLEKKLGPNKLILDRLCPDRPMILRSSDCHSLWVNSKALAWAGLDNNSPDPPGGWIARDPHSGELWGTVTGTACNLIPLPNYSSQQLDQSLAEFHLFMHKLGYTGYFSAGLEPEL